MISALPKSAGMPGDPRGLGDARNGQDAGDLFAQLLGASDVTPSVPNAGAGELQIALTVAESAIAQSQDGTEQADAAVPAPLARVFNQDGFFGYAVGNGEVIAGQVHAAVVRDALPGMNVADGEASLAAGSGEKVASRKIAGELPSRAVSPARISAGHAQHAGKPSATSPAIERALSTPFEPEGEGEGEADALQPLRRLLRNSMASQSTVQVAISEAEQGLRVIAHVAGLDETERRQLRAAITALLARHGLSADHIQINTMRIRGIEG